MTEILITSSVLILAILLLRKLFSGSLSRRVQYALWALVLVRLLVPVQLPMMNFSVLNAAKPVEHVVTKTVSEQPIYVPVAQVPLKEQPAARQAKPENTLIKVGQSVWIAEEEQETAVKYRCVSPLTILSWVRMAGSGLVGIFLLLANLRFWLWLRKARKPYEVEDCKLRVYLVEAGLPSPCLFGLFRPAIYLTPAALESETKLRHVLAHELTHARHLDHLWTFLRGVCLAVYWFDPLVWVAAAVSNADCELACDEGTLARLEEADRIPYGKTLLSLVPVRQTANPLLAATAMTAGKRQLKDRFTRIAKRSRQTVAAVVAVVLLVAAVSACTFTGGDPGGEKVIRIVTDLGRNYEHVTMSSNSNLSADAQLALDQAFEYLGGLSAGYTVEVEVLPTDEADYQSAMTRLRTEVMSGKGPDVFVLTLEDAAFKERVHERIFPDPYKTMLDGHFLNLDSYMDKAKFMEFEDMNPVVMAAGCTSEGRFALPMRYTFSFIRTGVPVENPGVDWFTGVEGDDPILAQSYAEASHYYFHNIFRDTVDYETLSLTFSEEELYHALSSAAALSTPIRGEWNEAITGGKAEVGIQTSQIPFFNPETKETDTYFPMRNREGGVSASVTAYIAINKNTRYPEEAFQVADMMMSKKFLSGVGFWQERTSNGPTAAFLSVFSYLNGVPVYDDMLQESQPVLYDFYIQNDMFPTYAALRDQITDARFITAVDQVLDDLKYTSWIEGMTPGDELKKYVADGYRKMLLMAGEL